MKRIFIIIAFLVFLFCSSAVSADTVSLSAEAENGSVTAFVNADMDFYGCSLEIIYDETMLEFIGSNFAEDLQAGSVLINPQYKNNAVKISILSLTPVRKGNICEIRFKVKKYVNGNCALDFGDVLFCDENADEIKTDKSGVTVSAVSSEQYTPSYSGGGYSKNEESKPEKAEPAKKPQDTPKAALPFDDVSKEVWYYSAVEKAYEKGLVKGISDTEFGADTIVSRGMFVTVLYRMENEPAAPKLNFADVGADEYFANATAWANAKGIVTGITETNFAPYDSITREQMATVLFRYAKYKGTDAAELTEDLDRFADRNEISEYAAEALIWAAGKGIIGGKGNGMLDPLGSATRAEMTAILIRFIEG